MEPLHSESLETSLARLEHRYASGAVKGNVQIPEGKGPVVEGERAAGLRAEASRQGQKHGGDVHEGNASEDTEGHLHPARGCIGESDQG